MVDPSVDALALILVIGQSGATAYHDGTVLTPAALNPGRALMFDAGIRVYGEQQTISTTPLGEKLPSANLSGLINLVEQQHGSSGQTVAATLCDYLLMHKVLGENVGIIVANVAIGSTSQISRVPGTEIWRTTEMVMERASLIGREIGKPVSLPFAIKIAGESDHKDSREEWAAKEIAEQASLTIAARRFGLRQPREEVVLINDQMGYVGTSEVPLAQLEVALRNSHRFLCAGPKYHLQPIDKIHLNACSQAKRGAEIAYAYGRWQGARSSIPLHLGPGTREGSVVRFPIRGDYVAPLVFDTALVTDPGNFGLKYFAAGDAQAIARVSIEAATLIVKLDAAPSGGPEELWVALDPSAPNHIGPTNGHRACIRDSSTDTYKTANGVNYPMYRWLSHQRVSVNA